MPKTTAKKTPSKRKPNAAFMRPVQPDEKLSAVVGSKPIPRSELTKKLWDYIKKNKFKTIHGEIEFGDNGEWKKSGMLQVQYHSIKEGAGLETWKGMGHQTVLTPDELKTGDLIYPYEKAK